MMSEDPKEEPSPPVTQSVTRDFNMTGEILDSVAADQRVPVEFVTYPQRLLRLARRLIDEGEFNIAVVAAHMACEIATEGSLSGAFLTRGIPDLEDPVMEFVNGHNLATPRIRELYTALTGDEVQKAVFWQKFKESAARRNNIIHAGAHAGKAEAEESYKAANDLVTHLKK
jgi:hypothetical protein